MKVLEGPRPAAESLAVPAWLADDPELRRGGIALVECLRPVSLSISVSQSLPVLLPAVTYDLRRRLPTF